MSLKHLDEFDDNGLRKSVMLNDDGTVFRPVDQLVYSVDCRLKKMFETGLKFAISEFGF